jgi:cholesterol transport system auxiliary component
MTHPTRRLVVAALALLPAGCGSVLGGGAAPNLYALTALDQFPATWPMVPLQFLIDRPNGTAALDTVRIALRRNGLSFDYFADANWADSAPSMVQSLLVESLQRSGRVAAASRETMAIRGDVELRIDLRHFEADYADGRTPPTVRVELGLILIRIDDRSIIGTRTAMATRRPGGNDVPAIVAAFDAALHDAMRETIGWMLTSAAQAQISRRS